MLKRSEGKRRGAVVMSLRVVTLSCHPELVEGSGEESWRSKRQDRSESGRNTEQLGSRMQEARGKTEGISKTWNTEQTTINKKNEKRIYYKSNNYY
jgi:hypothetical protein